MTSVLSVGEDITDALQAQKDLQATEREMERLMRVNMLGELASALAHELNQPLAAILSNAQAARRSMASNPADLGELREIVDDIIGDSKCDSRGHGFIFITGSVVAHTGSAYV
jgi:signal transduction histidine kinase